MEEFAKAQWLDYCFYSSVTNEGLPEKIFGETGMIRHIVFQPQTAEPAVCQVQMRFFTQPAFERMPKL